MSFRLNRGIKTEQRQIRITEVISRFNSEPDQVLKELHGTLSEIGLQRTGNVIDELRRMINFLQFYFDADGFLTKRETKPIELADFPSGQTIFIYNHPSLFRLVMGNPKFRPYYAAAATNVVKELFGNVVAAQIEGEDHQSARRKLVPLLTGKSLEAREATIVKNTEQLIKSLKGTMSDTVDIMPLLKIYTITNLGKGLLGADLSEEIPILKLASERAFAALFAKLFMPSWLPEIVSRRFIEPRERVKEITDRLIREKMLTGSWQNGTDIISGLIKSKRGEGEIDDAGYAYIRDETFGLLTGGHDTTANSLGWIVYAIQNHPTEYKYVFDSYGSGESETNNDEFEKRLDAFIKEVNRKYPTAAKFARMVTERHRLDNVGTQEFQLPDEVLGMEIPKGVIVMFSNLGRQRNKEIYGEDADKFNPRRFMDTEASKTYVTKGGFTPFGGGLHVCLGRDFAMRQQKAFVRALIQNDLYLSAPCSMPESELPILSQTIRSIKKLEVRVENAFDYFG